MLKCIGICRIESKDLWVRAMEGKLLERKFYMRDADQLAKDLLGKLLVYRTKEGLLSGVIVETEAYLGPEDLAAHSARNRKSERTKIMYESGGHAYVYLIYGMYCCFNVVANESGKPEAVLVRALEPVLGVEAMRKNRERKRLEDLCSGPGKLCAAMGIDRECNGEDLCGNRLYLEDYRSYKPEEIGVSPRINVDYAGEWKDRLLRYYVKGNSCVSKVGKKYRSELTLKDIEERAFSDSAKELL